MQAKTIKDKFDERWIPVTESGCWLWVGKTELRGYGAFRVRGRLIKAHRLSYELHIGPIPSGMYVCHKCDVTSCVNPNHLFLGSQQDNMDDMKRKGRELHQKGEDVGNSKLTENDIKNILLSDDTQRSLAKKFGVSKSTIGYIKRRQHWSHVPWPSEETRP